MLVRHRATPSFLLGLPNSSLLPKYSLVEGKGGSGGGGVNVSCLRKHQDTVTETRGICHFPPPPPPQKKKKKKKFQKFFTEISVGFENVPFAQFTSHWTAGVTHACCNDETRFTPK